MDADAILSEPAVFGLDCQIEWVDQVWQTKVCLNATDLLVKSSARLPQRSIGTLVAAACSLVSVDCDRGGGGGEADTIVAEVEGRRLWWQMGVEEWVAELPPPLRCSADGTRNGQQPRRRPAAWQRWTEIALRDLPDLCGDREARPNENLAVSRSRTERCSVRG